MSRPRRIPLRGDVTAAAVAELLGLSLPDFRARQDALRQRGFPDPFKAWLILETSNFMMCGGGQLA
jgi:hypothetical protein